MYFNEQALIQDCELYLKTYATTVAKAARDEGMKQARLAIEQFYSSYSPDYYDRTLDLLNNSYQPYYHDNGRTVYGGVRITGDAMQPYKSGLFGEVVADFTWTKGYHGYLNHDPNQAIYTFPPLSMLEMSMGMLKNKFYEEGRTAAKEQKYSVLRF